MTNKLYPIDGFVPPFNPRRAGAINTIHNLLRAQKKDGRPRMIDAIKLYRETLSTVAVPGRPATDPGLGASKAAVEKLWAIIQVESDTTFKPAPKPKTMKAQRAAIAEAFRELGLWFDDEHGKPGNPSLTRYNKLPASKMVFSRKGMRLGEVTVTTQLDTAEYEAIKDKIAAYGVMSKYVQAELTEALKCNIGFVSSETFYPRDGWQYRGVQYGCWKITFHPWIDAPVAPATIDWMSGNDSRAANARLAADRAIRDACERVANDFVFAKTVGNPEYEAALRRNGGGFLPEIIDTVAVKVNAIKEELCAQILNDITIAVPGVSRESLKPVTDEWFNEKRTYWADRMSRNKTALSRLRFCDTGVIAPACAITNGDALELNNNWWSCENIADVGDSTINVQLKSRDPDKWLVVVRFYTDSTPLWIAARCSTATEAYLAEKTLRAELSAKGYAVNAPPRGPTYPDADFIRQASSDRNIMLGDIVEQLLFERATRTVAKSPARREVVDDRLGGLEIDDIDFDDD